MGLQCQRHAAAGTAEAEVVLIRLDAALHHGDQPPLMGHVGHGQGLFFAQAALAGLLLHRPVKVQTHASVDGLVAVLAHRAAHAGRDGDIRGVSDNVLGHLNGHDNGIGVDIAIVQLQAFADQRADHRLDCQLSHHVGKAHHVYGVLQMLFQKVLAKACVAVIERNAVHLDLAGGIAVCAAGCVGGHVHSSFLYLSCLNSTGKRRKEKIFCPIYVYTFGRL